MSLLINLTPTEEALLSDAAMQTGLAPEVFVEKLVREHLPNARSNNYPNDELDKKLRQWQEQDGKTLMPTRTAAEIFAQWEKEASQMTDEEHTTEDQFWEDFQKGINHTRAALDMRQL
jgi:valyl-tRNA synthetase